MQTAIGVAIDHFTRARIGVVGDVMLDRFVWGNAERISPEAPVPLVSIHHETFVLGGASNVASNAVSLGGKVSLLGLIGDDEAGVKVQELCEQFGIDAFLARDAERPTTQKMRIVASGQQILRVDREVTAPLGRRFEILLKEQTIQRIPELDALVISDYAKGTLTRGLVKTAIKCAWELGKPIIGDLKPVNFSFCRGMTVTAPNEKEALEASGEKTVVSAGRVLQEKFGCVVLITRGEKGVSLFSHGAHCDFPAAVADVADATGAGDTVTAVLALALAVGLPLKEAAYLANAAGGIVVRKVGVASVSPDELKACVERYASG